MYTVQLKLLLLLLLLHCKKIVGQTQNEKSDNLSVAIMMANSHAPKATENEKKAFIMPTWGADINYQFNPRWAVALQTDIKLQSFEIKEDHGTLERINPFTVALVLHAYPLKHWSFYTGPGLEIEPSKNLWLLKLGTEYAFEIREDVEIGLNLIYENKEEIYDSWTFGISFNKRIWEKKSKP